MTVYKTRDSEYPVVILGDKPAISANKGPHNGSLYAILGFIPPTGKISVHRFGDNMTFWIEEEKREIPYDDLPKFLDKEPGKGKQLVGRLMDEKGNFVPSEAHDLIVTSSIEEVVQ